jgi:hypothetical protein
MEGLYNIYNIYYKGITMLEIVIGALLALAIRDLLYEVIDRVQSFIFRKREERYRDLLDEWLDEEI